MVLVLSCALRCGGYVQCATRRAHLLLRWRQLGYVQCTPANASFLSRWRLVLGKGLTLLRPAAPGCETAFVRRAPSINAKIKVKDSGKCLGQVRLLPGVEASQEALLGRLVGDLDVSADPTRENQSWHQVPLWHC